MTAAPVYDIDQFIADPHVQAREIVTELPDPEMGTVPMHQWCRASPARRAKSARPRPRSASIMMQYWARSASTPPALADLRKRKVI